MSAIFKGFYFSAVIFVKSNFRPMRVFAAVVLQLEGTGEKLLVQYSVFIILDVNTHTLLLFSRSLFIFLSIFSISFPPSSCPSLCADARGEGVEGTGCLYNGATGPARRSKDVTQTRAGSPHGCRVGVDCCCCCCVCVDVNLNVLVCLQPLPPWGSLTGGVIGSTACRNVVLLLLLSPIVWNIVSLV